MRKAALVILCCLMAPLSARSQKIDRDSLVRALSVYPYQDTGRVRLLNLIATQSWGSDPGKVLEHAQAALELSQKLDDTTGIADAYAALSKYYWSQTDHQKVIDLARMAAALYEKQHNAKRLAWCYGMIGLGYFQARNYDMSIHYHALAKSVNERILNKPGIARDLNNLGCVYELKEDYTKALDFYQQALAIWQDANEQENIIMALANIGNILLLTGSYPLAKNYLVESLDRARKISNKNLIAYISQNLGVAYYKTGDHAKAEAFLKEAIALGGEIGDKRRKEEAYQIMVDLKQSVNDYKSALNYQRLLQGIRDSLYSEQQIRQSAEMEARYQTGKKQQEIELLEQKSKVQMLWRNTLLTGLILTMVVSVIIYRLQRSRTRKTKLLLETQELMVRQLEQSDKLKSRFFANISHEFRTPLTLILTPVEDRLSAETGSEKDKVLFQSIRRNASRLLELINQLLDLSRLEAGFTKLQHEPGNLNRFFLPILCAFDSLADINKISYHKEVTISETTVLFDADKMEKILTNLLSNAFKFTGKNGKVIARVLTTEREHSVDVNLEITNSTVAPLEEPDKIFEPFIRGNSNNFVETPGTGLGLSLVKELVKLNNGQIRLVCNSREQITFAVDLSFHKTSLHDACPDNINMFPPAVDGHPEVADLQQADTEKETILVVEDNIEVRALLRQGLLNKYNVLEAPTGRAGLDVLEAQHADVVVADVMMPVMDGIELCRKIKGNEATSHIPVILLTAKADQKSKLEGLHTGADDYVIKPFNLEELTTRIANLIEQRKRLIRKYIQDHGSRPRELTVNAVDERFAMKLTEVIERNLDNTLFDLNVMSRELGISRTNLHRKIKAITGLAPGEFVQDFRLRKAAELIERKTDLISQIAYRVGFNDQSYFSKCFKKKFGKNPTEYAA